MKRVLLLIALTVQVLASYAVIANKTIDGGGSGPFKAEAVSEPSLPDFVIYRPQDLKTAVENQGPLPLVVFANGGCMDTSLIHERLLNDVASYGYIIIALGEMQQAFDDRKISTSPNSDMPRAIDWALEQNDCVGSEYHGCVDTEYIALAGQSCGGAMVLANCQDPRVKTYIMFNSGIGDMDMADANKDSLALLHGPIVYIIGGETDVAYLNALKDYDRISHVPVAVANEVDAGHGGTFDQEYGGSFSQMMRAWLSWQFKGQRNNLAIFLQGRLKDFPNWTMQAKNFLKGDVDLTLPQRVPGQFPTFDPSYPDVHDPVMAYEDGKYYMFTTGFGIGMFSSDDNMKTWRQERAPLDPLPQWAMDLVPAYKGHTWAPDIIKVGDKWYLYYSCSTFGKNISVIGVMTSPYLDPERAQWTDLGMVVRSQPGITDWNAIDPNVIIDEEGQPWLTFGSFWDGIQLVKLDKDMKTPIGEPRTIARRRCPCTVAHLQEHANTNAIEAPFIIHHDGYYYLFASHDYCCQGLSSNYKTVVGRSRTVDGPYLDSEGVDMADTGGDIIAQENDRYAGIGHCSVYDFDGTTYFIAHAYDKQHHGASKLYVRPITWHDGWPKLD